MESPYRKSAKYRAACLKRSKEAHARNSQYETYRKLRSTRTLLVHTRNSLARILARADEQDKKIFKLLAQERELRAAWKKEQDDRRKSCSDKLTGPSVDISDTVHPGDVNGSQFSG